MEFSWPVWKDRIGKQSLMSGGPRIWNSSLVRIVIPCRIDIYMEIFEALNHSNPNHAKLHEPIDLTSVPFLVSHNVLPTAKDCLELTPKSMLPCEPGPAMAKHSLPKRCVRYLFLQLPVPQPQTITLGWWFPTPLCVVGVVISFLSKVGWNVKHLWNHSRFHTFYLHHFAALFLKYQFNQFNMFMSNSNWYW